VCRIDASVGVGLELGAEVVRVQLLGEHILWFEVSRYRTWRIEHHGSLPCLFWLRRISFADWSSETMCCVSVLSRTKDRDQVELKNMFHPDPIRKLPIKNVAPSH
jgi:hypothetical protein